jgi:hypothetical protein
MQARLAALLDAYHQGAGPGDLAVRGLKSRVREQESHLANQYDQLSPQDRRAAAPGMQAVEEQRRDVEEEELRRRKALNETLERGRDATMRFAQGLLAGNPVGGLVGGVGALGMASGLVATAMGTAVRLWHEHEAEVRTGGARLSPMGADTERESAELRKMIEALRENEMGRQSEAARMEQRRGQARDMGMGRIDDPENNIGRWAAWVVPLDLRRSPGAARTADLRYLGELLTGGTGAEAGAARSRALADYYEQWIKQHGGELKPVLRNIPNLGEPGYTTGAAFHDELQMATLQRNDVNNAQYQLMVDMMRRQGVLLEAIANNTSDMQNFRPRWE